MSAARVLETWLVADGVARQLQEDVLERWRFRPEVRHSNVVVRDALNQIHDELVVSPDDQRQQPREESSPEPQPRRPRSPSGRHRNDDEPRFELLA